MAKPYLLDLRVQVVSDCDGGMSNEDCDEDSIVVFCAVILFRGAMQQWNVKNRS